MRIRYRKTRQEGVWESIQRFKHPTNGAVYRLLLNYPAHQWLIVDDASDLVAASGTRVHPHKMKIDARYTLHVLGVMLIVDERKKKEKKPKFFETPFYPKEDVS